MSALTVFLTTYNTGLQGSLAQEQDLSSWLIPVLHNHARKNGGTVPDIYAIGVQELLPLHLACKLSKNTPTLVYRVALTHTKSPV